MFKFAKRVQSYYFPTDYPSIFTYIFYIKRKKPHPTSPKGEEEPHPASTAPPNLPERGGVPMRTRGGLGLRALYLIVFCKILANLPPPLSGRSGGASFLQTARHTQRCSNGSEHRDNHINDCFPFFVFHKAFYFEIWGLKFEQLTLNFEVWTLNFMICDY